MEQQAAVNVIDADQAGASDSGGPRSVGKQAPGPPVGIRNVALVGHNGSGKTTLAEALLFATGAITRQGQGRRRLHGVRLRARGDQAPHVALARPWPRARWATSRSTSSTPPATPTSSARCSAACSVVDLAVIVVSAVEGIEAQTEAVWDLAAELACPA